MAKLRIMSNNVWRNDKNLPAWEANGYDCAVETRVPGLFKAYRETLPDIIGIQECSPRMADLLMREFSGEKMPYMLIWGKDSPIIYRTDKFELVDSELFIYGDRVPGYDEEFKNYHPKAYCAAVFRVKENGKMFVFGNTHLWWKSGNPANKNYLPHSDEAREYFLGQLMDSVDLLVKKYNCPSIIVGDMNAKCDSPALKAAFERGYLHAHDVAAEYADETMGMHYCYGDGFDTKPYPKTFADSIDHILIRGFEDGFVRRFERFSPDYYMPLSDHFPVWIDVEFN